MPEIENITLPPETNDGSDMFTTEETSQSKNIENPQEQVTEQIIDQTNQEHLADEPTQAQAGIKEQRELTVRVKYNGAEKDIPIAEAIILAQKGMNYDKVVKERDTLRSSPERKEIEYWAERNNMTPEEYVQFLTQKRQELSVQQEIDAIKTQRPELDDDVILELANTRAQNKERDMRDTAARRLKEEEAVRLKPWSDFLQAYPDIKDVSKIPEEVMELVDSGETPIAAMRKYEVKELQKKLDEQQKQIEILTKNKQNKESALPSAQSTGSELPMDAFLQGLLE